MPWRNSIISAIITYLVCLTRVRGREEKSKRRNKLLTREERKDPV
jgi:hypothetical protein